MWKTFAEQGRPSEDARRGEQRTPGYLSGKCVTMQACSACAGDYEDPDRTAWTAGEANDEDSGELQQGEHRELEDQGQETRTGAEDIPGR